MNSMTRGKWLALLCLVPFALFFIVFEIAPLVWVLINSLQTEESGWGLENFTRIFSSKFYRQAIQLSLEISFYSSIFGIIIATLGSYSLRRVDSPLRNFVTAFANMTSNFAGVPLAFAFIILLGFNGSITIMLKQAGIIQDFNLYSKTGLIILYTYFQIPLECCCSTRPLMHCAKTGVSRLRCSVPMAGSSGDISACRCSPLPCLALSSSCWPTPLAPTPRSTP